MRASPARRVGPEALDPIVEGSAAANLKSIVTKLDKHHPEMKGSTPAWQRQHLRALLGGTVEPDAEDSQTEEAGPPAKGSSDAERRSASSTEAMSVFRESLKRK